MACSWHLTTRSGSPTIGDHTVRQCTLEGKVLLTLGISGKPAPYMSGEPFHRCTHTAMSPQGDIYVSDGYGNSRVHKYAPNGKLLFSWGGPGTDPGEFNIAHNITCDADGWVYVADRENHRVQVFDGNGKYETQWNNLHRPCGLFMPPGKCPVCYIGELGAVQPVSRNVPNLGPRVTIVDNTGKRISRLGGLGPGLGPTEFLTRSCSVLTGTDGCTASTSRTRATNVSRVRSFCQSNGNLAIMNGIADSTEPLVNPMVYPSSGLLATESTPVTPPAPARFSRTTCCPSSALSPCARMREKKSDGPPAGNGTTSLIGRTG